ncbi:hypothetical protein [Pseudomonas sp. SED1]|uniref:hypothetical protein n=1 Tax=Pseudomonas sp. SED1 TaxID=3056845 RepID=UPI00296E7B58|nr:hypothetical protein [Pseudomonas sp. SED1]MDY0833438.1 hypothetical protein [Pseudomonas sp. SED1]
MREKSEGLFGGVFPGAQKQQNPHEAGFGGALYLVGRGNLNLLSRLLTYKVNIVFCFWLEYQLEYRAKLVARLHFDLTTECIGVDQHTS